MIGQLNASLFVELFDLHERKHDFFVAEKCEKTSLIDKIKLVSIFACCYVQNMSVFAGARKSVCFIANC